jgi:hypothetical protein
VASLALNLEAFPGLFVTKMDVEDFHKQMTEALNTNKGETTGVKGASAALEAARKAAAVHMYANLGHLMAHFAEDPKQVKRFFETGKLRRRRRIKTTHMHTKQQAA